MSMSDDTTIEPALSREQWAAMPRVHLLRPESDRDDGFVVDAKDGFLRLHTRDRLAGEQVVYVRREHVPALIAIANDVLPDDDPRKITRERVDLLRKAAEMIEIEYDARDNESYEVVTLRAFADALASYLPPERA